MPPFQPKPGDIKIRRENQDGTWLELYLHPDNAFTITSQHPHGFLGPPLGNALLELVALLRKYALLRKIEMEKF